MHLHDVPYLIRCNPWCANSTLSTATLFWLAFKSDPLHFTGLKGRFKLAGPSLGNVGDVLGITLPTMPPFDTHVTLVKDGGLWKAVFESARTSGAASWSGHTFVVPPIAHAPTGR